MARRGVTAVETAIGVALASIVLLFCINVISQFLTFGAMYIERTQALYLTEDVLESVRFARDGNVSGFLALSPGTTYYVATSSMIITTTPQPVGVFTPSFRVYQVRRSAGDDIVASGGSVDPNTLRVVASTTWNGGEVALSAYLADISP